MKKEYLFDKISDLKEKFKSFFQHRKKITALENYSLAAKFPHKNYLPLVKACMNEGFLGDEESKFLDHMLTKYELNYLDWAHKTKWLKKEMMSRQGPKLKPIQTFFNFERKEATINVPLEILGTMKPQNGARI